MAQPTLFDRWETPTKRRMIVTVARDLRKLAAIRKDFGVTAYDSRRIAISFGFATGTEANQRALSWLSAVPRVARLRRTERTRLSPQRNEQRVYVR